MDFGSANIYPTEPDGSPPPIVRSRIEIEVLRVNCSGILSGLISVREADFACSFSFLAGDDPRIGGTPHDRRVLLGWFGGTRCVLLEDADEDMPALAGECFAPFQRR